MSTSEGKLNDALELLAATRQILAEYESDAALQIQAGAIDRFLGLPDAIAEKRCTLCGHDKNTDQHGVCRTTIYPYYSIAPAWAGGSELGICGCKCEFAIAEEGNKKLKQ